ncbi:hypothetical protein HY991_00835 [Candidatus Micrarchaeota archaeon]|nr:hypothetical protein [Candidatus Micrarchaeota archaeon]
MKRFKGSRWKSGARGTGREGFRVDRRRMLEKAKKEVREAFSRKDLMLVQGIRSLDELDEIKGLLYTRIDEWFKLNFPEFSVENEESACKIIAEFGCKEALEEKKLAEIVGEKKGRELMDKAKASYGAPFEEGEVEALKQLAKKALSIFEARKGIEKYINAEAPKHLKNLCYLVEPTLASRLVMIAGGLEKLAKMPASTVQVIGAEKALFKHLRSGTKPPKHGIIFQSAYIRTAPFKERGKIARALSTKLAIAAKADFYTKHFIAEKLKENLEKRLDEIKRA